MDCLLVAMQPPCSLANCGKVGIELLVATVDQQTDGKRLSRVGCTSDYLGNPGVDETFSGAGPAASVRPPQRMPQEEDH